MPAIVQKLECSQLPGVTIVSVGEQNVKYLTHMQKLFGYLLKKTNVTAANTAMHMFLRSVDGKAISRGGDLVSEYTKGPLDAMLYTHGIGLIASKTSYFLTLAGVRHVLETLPNQDEVAKQKLRSLLQDHLLDQATARACMQPATGDFLEEDADHADINEARTWVARRESVSSHVFEYCRSYNEDQRKHVEEQIRLERAVKDAELKAKDVELKAKDAEMKAELRVKDAEMKAALEAKDAEIKAKEESARKDLTIAKLEMELEFRKRLSAAPEPQAKVSRTGPKRLDVRATFCRLRSLSWPNAIEGVHDFVYLPYSMDANVYAIDEQRVMPMISFACVKGMNEVHFYCFVVRTFLVLICVHFWC